MPFLRERSPDVTTTATEAVDIQLQLSSLLSAGQSAVMLCGWGVKAGMVHSSCG